MALRQWLAGPAETVTPHHDLPPGPQPGGWMTAGKIPKAPRSVVAAIAIAAVVVVSALAASTGTRPPSPSPGGSALPTAIAATSPTAGPDFLLISGDRLRALPAAGPAWDEMKDVADGDLGTADLTDQDNKHGVRTLAAALVYARTKDPAYFEKTRAAVMEAIGTERIEATSSILALGRQLAPYVLAADLIELSGEDDQVFREWLSEIRTRELGGHGRWKALTATHEDSTNNWGAFAGASRIAASLYLEDEVDVGEAAQVMRGFLGDREAWSEWQDLERADRRWACDPAAFTPINPPCIREGIDVNGAIVTDISRNGSPRWPPGRDAILYTTESMQGLALQAELLQMADYDPWEWSDRALLRAALLLERADGWNETPVSHHVAWIFNARYSLSIPTLPAGYGRLLGYTDWLYGSD